MKKMSKILALVLVLVLVLSLSACAGKGSGIAGTWVYTMDFQKAMESAGGVEGLGEELQGLGESVSKLFEGLSMKYVLELKSDNSYVCHVDEASAKAAIEGMGSKMGEIIPALMGELFSISAEEFSAMMEEAGTSLDEMVSEMMGEMNTDELIEQLKENDSKGSYRYEEGKLFLTPEGETEDSSKYLSVELNGNELKITADNGLGIYEQFKELMPLVFTR